MISSLLPFLLFLSAPEPIEAIRCTGDQQLKLQKKQLEGRAPIVVSGRCKLELWDSKIEGLLLIKASEEAQIHLHGCELRGEIALLLEDKAQLWAEGSLIEGGVFIQGAARFYDEGKNRLYPQPGSAPKPPPPKPKVPPRPESLRPGLRSQHPIACRGDRKLKFKNRLIKSQGVGVLIRDRCELELQGCTIQGARFAAYVQGQGRLILRDCTLESSKVALKLKGRAQAEVRGSKIRGEIITLDRSKLLDLGGNTFSPQEKAAPGTGSGSP